MSNKKILLLAVILGLVTALTLNFYLRQLKESVTKRDTQKVVVTVAAIPAKTIVTREMVTLQDIPKDFVHVSAVTDVSQVVGNLTRADMVAGEQVLKEKLMPQKNQAGGLSNLIPLGMRAISIPVSEVTGVSGLVVPGDRVDLIGTIEIENPSVQVSGNVRPTGQVTMQANAEKLTVTHVLIQDVEVLAIGKNMQTSTVTANKDEKKEDAEVKTMTLAVPADKVQVLALMEKKGEIMVSLRSPADRSINYRPPFKGSQLIK